jgi:hypothetical protein
MTTDVAIYDYTTTNNTLEYILSKKTTPQDKKDAELLIHKANYTASSRAKHLMLLIDGNNSSINNEGSFVDIVDRIKSGTQEKVELTISDKKSSTTSTKESKAVVKNLLKEKFSPLYITRTGSKRTNGIYKLKDGSFVKLINSSITYDKGKFIVGKKSYTLIDLTKALGYNKIIPDNLRTALYANDKNLNVYLLYKETAPKESTTTTPPPSTRKPKDEKPKEVVIDMTKQFEIGGNKYIPLYENSGYLFSIMINEGLKIVNRAVPIELKYLTKKYNVNTTNILVERSKEDIAIPRIKSGGNIYIVQGDKVSVYPKLSNLYNNVNETYFNKCKQ